MVATDELRHGLQKLPRHDQRQVAKQRDTGGEDDEQQKVGFVGIRRYAVKHDRDEAKAVEAKTRNHQPYEEFESTGGRTPAQTLDGRRRKQRAHGFRQPTDQVKNAAEQGRP